MWFGFVLQKVTKTDNVVVSKFQGLFGIIYRGMREVTEPFSKRIDTIAEKSSFNSTYGVGPSQLSLLPKFSDSLTEMSFNVFP